MIDATVEENGSKQASGDRKRLTDEEICSHCIIFILAGYETTANALSYTAYLLALHPHIQEKLQGEVDKFFQENPVLGSYGSQKKCLVVKTRPKPLIPSPPLIKFKYGHSLVKLK